MNRLKWIILLLLLTSLIFGAMVFLSCFSDECPSSGAGDDDDGDDIDDDDTAPDDDDDDTVDDDDATDDDTTDDDDDSEEVWEDSTSGLMWQNDWKCCDEWGEAKTYCENLTWNEKDDWRLPSISELRTLIRGCSDTETGGECGVTDSCLESDCSTLVCEEGCESFGGPGSGGRYWPEDLKGARYEYWSSSAIAGSYDTYAWIVGFGSGYIRGWGVSYTIFSVRCVRDIN